MESRTEPPSVTSVRTVDELTSVRTVDELTSIRTVDALMTLLHACRGAWDTPDRSGDPVDLHDHALQTAALLRRSHPADKELQVAGLVHDLGHLLRPGDDAAHADHAAAAVRPLLGDRVAELVRLHVPAKRYLAATEPGRALSEQSALTLRAQGGVMTHEEAGGAGGPPLRGGGGGAGRGGGEGRPRRGRRPRPPRTGRMPPRCGRPTTPGRWSVSTPGSWRTGGRCSTWWRVRPGSGQGRARTGDRAGYA
ncbi:inositol oxygenase family protein [Streptomyces sp. N35]|uniref:inositol oxygenase family protein n=1 Tax=Streptomyces sp. N35 TaxID=2795730 RepID=UPI0035AB84ED